MESGICDHTQQSQSFIARRQTLIYQRPTIKVFAPLFSRIGQGFGGAVCRGKTLPQTTEPTDTPTNGKGGAIKLDNILHSPNSPFYSSPRK